MYEVELTIDHKTVIKKLTVAIIENS